MNCGICLQPIYLIYHKSNCKCRCYYHIDCVISWYNINNSCIYCKKKDNININYLIKKQNKFYQLISYFIILSILFIFFF